MSKYWPTQLWLIILFSFLLSNVNAQVDTLIADNFVREARKSFKEKKFELAIATFDKAIEIYSTAGNWSKYIKALSAAGKRLAYMSQYERSITYLNSALSTSLEKFGKIHPNSYDVYSGLGLAYFRMREFPKAIKQFQIALEIQEELFGKDHLQVAASYNNLGVLYSKTYNTEKQQYYFQHSLDIKLAALKSNPDLKLNDQIATAYHNLSTTFSDNKDHKKQYKYLQKALTIWIAEKGEKHLKTALAYTNLAGYFGELGDHEKELNYLTKSLFIRLELYGERDSDVANAYENIGSCHLRLNEYDQALNYYSKALQLKLDALGTEHPDVAKSYTLIGNYYVAKSEWQNALPYYQNALIGLLKDFDENDPYQNPVIKADEINTQLLNTLYSKANTLFKLYNKQTKDNKDLTFAFKTYQLTIDLIDHLRTSGLMDIGQKGKLSQSYMQAYENAIHAAYLLHKQTNDPTYLSLAFEFAEKSKSFLLLEALNEIQAKSFGGVPDSLLLLEKKLQLSIINLEKKRLKAKEKSDSSAEKVAFVSLLKKRDQHRQLIARFEELYPKYHRLKYNNKLTQFSDIQRILKNSKELFVEYFYGKNQLFVFSIDKKKLNLTKINIPNDLESLVSSVRKCLTDYNYINENSTLAYDQFTNSALKLYQQILAPVLDKHPKAEKLHLVPDGILGHIPFGILLKHKVEENGINYADLAYLIKTFRINYAYSGTLLLQNLNNTSKRVSSRCLAFAPSYRKNSTLREFQASGELGSLNSSKAELPGALKEVKAISSHLQGDFYYGKDATRKNFIDALPNYGIVHLAMHGKANDKHPMYSSLYFADDSISDNSLFAYELHGLDLNAHLVVLSACETGYGKYIRGEGVMSLARGFLYAGSPSVVMTLWKVNDSRSSNLISNFYSHLVAGKEKDDALRQAKLDYLKSNDKIHVHPAFWAGFVTMGNEEAIVLRTSSIPYLWIGLGLLGFGLLGFLIRQRFKVYK